MKAGETQRFDCPECLAEFEITFEPKAKGRSALAKGIHPKQVTTCPFCNADLNDEDDDDGLDDDE